MLRCLLILVLIPATTLTATAQALDSPYQSEAVILSPPAASDWIAPTKQPPYVHNLVIVTVTQPHTRHGCRVRQITADSIICRSNLSHNEVTYQRDNIAAIIDPPTHTVRNYMITLVAISAVCLAGSFFVPLLPSVILRVVSFLSIFSGPVGLIGADADRDHDLLVYQRPNTPLTIALR